MRTTFTMLLIVAIMVACAPVNSSRPSATRVSNIPSSRQTIIGQRWTPSSAQTRKALQRIQQFLDNPTPDYRSDLIVMEAIRDVSNHAAQYYVQFIGVRIEGRTLIHCNFLALGTPPWASDWKTKEAWATDGGYNYWRIFYEPSTGKCVGFSINAYA